MRSSWIRTATDLDETLITHLENIEAILGAFIAVVDEASLTELESVLPAIPEPFEVSEDENLRRSGKVEAYVDVVCSDVCRDRLLLEGHGAAVSVWRTGDGSQPNRVAGAGPYERMPSVCVLVDEAEPSRSVVAASWLEDSTLVEMRPIAGDEDLWRTYRRRIESSDWIPVSHPGEYAAERFFVDLETDGRTDEAGETRAVTFASIPVDRPVPRVVRVERDLPDVWALLSLFEERDVRAMSYLRARKLLEVGFAELASMEERGTLQRCLHPRLSDGRCASCGRVYRCEHRGGGVAYPLTPPAVLHRGIGGEYRWNVSWLRTASGLGIEYLNRYLQIDEWEPVVEVVEDASEPEPAPEPESAPEPARKARPMIAGYSPSRGVIVFEDEATRLAELHDVVDGPAKVSDLLGTARALGFDWMERALSDWLEYEGDSDDVMTEYGRYRPDATVHIDHDFWHGEEGYGPWPWLDGIDMSMGPAMQVAELLGTTVDELPEVFGMDVEPDWIRYYDIDEVVEALKAVGAPIRIDNDLVKRAGGEVSASSPGHMSW